MRPTPVDIVVAAHSKPPIPEPIQVSPQTVRIMAMGKSRTVDRADTDSADDVEPVAPLGNEVLAGAHLPTAFGASTG